MVYLDDIKVYPCRPVGLATDLSDDCLVDFRELARWLPEASTPRAPSTKDLNEQAQGEPH